MKSILSIMLSIVSILLIVQSVKVARLQLVIKKLEAVQAKPKPPMPTSKAEFVPISEAAPAVMEGEKFGRFRVLLEVTPGAPMDSKRILSAVDALCAVVVTSSTIKRMEPMMVAGASQQKEKVTYKVIGNPP